MCSYSGVLYKEGRKMKLKVGDIVEGVTTIYWSYGGKFKVVSINDNQIRIGPPLVEYDFSDQYRPYNIFEEKDFKRISFNTRKEKFKN